MAVKRGVEVAGNEVRAELCCGAKVAVSGLP